METPGGAGEESSGATCELARGPRALPIPVSEFGLNAVVNRKSHMAVTINIGTQ